MNEKRKFMIVLTWELIEIWQIDENLGVLPRRKTFFILTNF